MEAHDCYHGTGFQQATPCEGVTEVKGIFVVAMGVRATKGLGTALCLPLKL